MAEHTTFRIRAYLQCGVISDPYLPLDALMYYLAHREALGGSPDVSLPGARISEGNPGADELMPFGCIHRNRLHWQWACSFAQWPERVVEDKDHWACRFDAQFSDLVDFGKRRGKVSQASGRYKAHRMPVFYRHALYVEWYARGDRTKLERLLPFATHLGKKASQGWGAILRWQVDDWPEDWSMYGPGGRLMRPRYDASSTVRYGIRPAYWLTANQFPVELPPGC